MSAPKILVISNTPFFGGGEAFIVDTLVHLREPLYYLVRNTTLADSLPADRVFRFSKTSFAGQLSEVRRVIAGLDPDCVIFNGGRTLFFVPWVRAKRKILYRHTTNQCIGNRLKRLIYDLSLHVCYSRADAVVHVSEFARREQKLFKDKAVCIHHGVVPLPYEPKSGSGPVRFLFLGRTEPDKGIEIIVRAFAKLPAEMAVLDVVGTGESASWLAKLDYGNIRYHGFSKMVAEWYDSADVFVSLPRHEAFGLTILEAMNHGLPILTCRTGGIPEIVRDGENAIVSPPVEHAVFAAMLRLCRDRSLIARMGKRSHEICCGQFSLDRTLAKIEQVINP